LRPGVPTTSLVVGVRSRVARSKYACDLIASCSVDFRGDFTRQLDLTRPCTMLRSAIGFVRRIAFDVGKRVYERNLELLLLAAQSGGWTGSS
jgi:hypothetical protein